MPTSLTSIEIIGIKLINNHPREDLWTMPGTY